MRVRIGVRPEFPRQPRRPLLLSKPMNTSILTCGLLFFSFCLNAAGAGVSGRVLLRGTPPPERVIEMTADCAAAQERPPTTRHYTVDRDGGLANVFVVIRSG